MMLKIPAVLSPGQVAQVRGLIESAEGWVDGLATAGWQGAPVKRNHQMDEQAPAARAAQRIILAALETNPTFISAALPHAVYPPMFNRYGAGQTFGAHVDGAVRLNPQTGAQMRTDVSATLFLNDPDDYDGGELQVIDTFATHGVKLAAGDLVLYPATSLHQVTPVTRGVRLASFFWVQSMIRDDARRELAFDLDSAIQRLSRTGGDDAARTALVGCYHNLLRMWAQT
ncbi:Fe2+-dependent dioxygenase [Novosphingobium sp. FSW06-99]|uniref:Fe2+-dependent dioxygenase n=1 Tax=Novosphingobium sp. FSW06-99 TaxID=1739113 RepID=UPI00076D375B|nr:Fe2+-dependent dioxygenase [Novosphingobium sp. FSW06-99]KUR75125.1 Fe(II)-dependent oxygenase [Novosphingobium sp. FSW06-99]